jgi:pyruvate/2-oxoglutarate dehydrogenase complex dihydrolipoamide acyltransferase (E2) component
MSAFTRAMTGVVSAVLVAAGATLHADTVQLSLHDGRISLSATNATPAQIFEAWSRAGGVLIVNADRIQSLPLTLTLDNVPEEQALETILRPVTGYLARRRVDATANASVFDRIVIMATPLAPRPAVAAAPPPPSRPGPVFPQSPPPQAQQPQAPPAAPAAIPQGPGVMRLIGPDGRPVEDDQGNAPQQYTPGDPPDGRNQVARPAPPPPNASQPPQAQPTPPTSAPAGVPRPGMVVPAPNTPGQPGQPPQQQPRQ